MICLVTALDDNFCNDFADSSNAFPTINKGSTVGSSRVEQSSLPTTTSTTVAAITDQITRYGRGQAMVSSTSQITSWYNYFSLSF